MSKPIPVKQLDSAVQNHINDSGIHGLSASGTPAAGQITIWNSATQLEGDPGFLWNDTSRQLDARTASTTLHSSIGLNRSRGSLGSPTTVQTGDVLGSFDFYGRLTSEWVPAFQIQAEAVGTWSAGEGDVTASDLNFIASKNGIGGGATTRMTISSAGDVTIPTGYLIVNEFIRVGSTSNATAGNIRWNGSNFQGYNGSGWVALDTQGFTSAGGSNDQIQYNNNGPLGGASLYWNGTMLQFSGQTSSYPGLKRNGVNLETRLANNSALTGMWFSEGTAARYSSSQVPCGEISLRKSRGTESSPLNPSSGDYLGQVISQSWESPSWYDAALIRFVASDTWTNSYRPSHVEIYTTATTSQQLALKIKSTLDVDVTGGLMVGSAANANAGRIQWDGVNFQGYTGSGWVDLDSQSSGGTVGGTGAANQIAYFSNGTDITSESNLGWNPSTDTLAVTGAMTVATTGSDTTEEAWYLTMVNGDSIGWKEALHAEVTHSPGNAVTVLGGASIQLITRKEGLGTITNMQGIVAARHLDGGHIDSSYGLQIASVDQVSGTIDEDICFYISDHHEEGANYNASIYTGTGRIRFGDAVQIGARTAGSDTAGQIQWTGSDFQGYTGSVWKSLTDTGGAGTVDTTGTITSDQVAVFSDANTLKSSSKLTHSGSSLVVGNGTESAQFVIDGASSTYRQLRYYTNGTERWRADASSVAESGSNVGSDYEIHRYDDAGSWISTPLFIKRSTGYIGINTTPAAQLEVAGPSTNLLTLDSSHADATSLSLERSDGIAVNFVATTSTHAWGEGFYIWTNQNGGEIPIGFNSSSNVALTGTEVFIAAGSPSDFDIRKGDNNHRIRFLQSANELELMEYGDVVISAGATAGTRTSTAIFAASGLVTLGNDLVVTGGDIYTGGTAGPLTLSGGNSAGSGANIELYGSSGGNANDAYYDADMHTFRSQGASTRMYIDNGYIVGAQRFVCNDNYGYMVRDGSSAWGFMVYADTSDAYLMQSASAGSVNFHASHRALRVNFSTGDMYIANSKIFVDVSASRVGINDTTPSYSLDVNGTIRGTTSVLANDLNDIGSVNNYYYYKYYRPEMGGGNANTTPMKIGFTYRFADLQTDDIYMHTLTNMPVGHVITEVYASLYKWGGTGDINTWTLRSRTWNSTATPTNHGTYQDTRTSGWYTGTALFTGLSVTVTAGKVYWIEVSGDTPTGGASYMIGGFRVRMYGNRVWNANFST